MIKHLDNETQNSLSGLSDFSVLLSNTKLLKKMLARHWETCLLVYTKTKNESFFYQNMHSSYFLQIELPYDYNYLFLAKIVDFVCNTHNLQYIVRQLAKKEFQHRQLEEFLSNKSARKSLFVLWLVRLSLEQFKRYIRRYNLYLAESGFILDWHKIKIQYFSHSLFLGMQDFLILRLYARISQIWYIYACRDHANKITINHNLLQLNGEPSGLSCLESHIQFLAPNQRTHTKKVLLPTDRIDLKRKLNRFYKQKYINLIKNLIRCNKIIIQAHLIQKINNIIRSWDRSLLTVCNKEEYKQLNHIVNQSLSLWGISRHGKHSAKWIKKRYWHNFEDGLYFSTF